MGASDFLSGGVPRFGARVLADSTQVRRTNEREPAGRRPPVLQSSRGPIQLSLFDHLEPVTQPLQVPEGDAAAAIDARAVASPDDSDCSRD